MLPIPLIPLTWMHAETLLSIECWMMAVRGSSVPREFPFSIHIFCHNIHCVAYGDSIGHVVLYIYGIASIQSIHRIERTHCWSVAKEIKTFPRQ